MLVVASHRTWCGIYWFVISKCPILCQLCAFEKNSTHVALYDKRRCAGGTTKWLLCVSFRNFQVVIIQIQGMIDI